MKKVSKILRCLFSILCMLTGIAVYGNSFEIVTEASQQDCYLTMDVIDVGQGLSLLFESDGHYMLYDGGGSEYSSKVVAYLKKKGIEQLDYVVASHYDDDHLNGVVGVLHVFDVSNVIAPDYETDTRVFESFTEIIPEKGLSITAPEVGSQFYLGSTIVTIIAPNGSGYSNVNDYSVGLRLDCKENSILVTGDATALSEQEMIAGGQNLDADVLVIGHHGSDSSTSEAFLDTVLPEIAVISCGIDNEYLHPDQDVMERLQNRGIAVYRTEKQGDLIISTDGSSFTASVDPCNDYSCGAAAAETSEMYATAAINVRSSQSTDSEILGGLAAGEQIEVISAGDEWATIIYNGTTAYVASQYISADEPVQAEEPSAEEEPAGEEQQQTGGYYVLNTNTGKFHRPDCSSVDQMKAKNRLDSYESREAIISMGYDPCKRCYP